MEIKKAKVLQDYLNGVMSGEKVVNYKKLLKDARHFYQKGNCDLADDTLMYQVYSYSQGNPEQSGNLNWGLTVMESVLINNECNITRGHFHENLDCAEIYFCLHGEGLLMFMDENGNCFAEEMKVGTIHHIDGKLAHRLVNIGNEQLRVGACWPTTAGHDYERVEKKPFTTRIFKEHGLIVTKENR